MKNEKLCEYLSDIGVLLFDNIDLFFQIYSTNNSKKFNTEQEKLKNSLFLYLQKTSKDENLLKEISFHLIEAYYNTHIINKYKSLKSLFNILKFKYFSHYNYFITRISLYIIKKTKATINFEPLKEKDNSKGNNSEDLIMRKEKDLDNEKLKNKNENNNEKVNIKEKKKKKNRIKKTNRYQNNYFKNINENLDKDNNIDNKYNIDYNDMNNFDDNPNYLNYNDYNNYNNLSDEDEEFLNYYNNNPVRSNKIKSSKLPINYYTSIYKQNPENIEDIHIPSEQYISNINTNTNEATDPNLKTYDFFENQERHEKRVKNKLLNLQNEKLINMEKECTFTPKINSPTTKRTSQKYIIDNKFEKLYNDSKMNKIKKEQNIKKHLEEFKFTPNLKKTENYIVLTTFQERLEKSINTKENKKNQNNIQNKNKKKEEKKNSVIDWEKIIKENNEKYKNENHYGNNIQKKKKNLENIQSQIADNNISNSDNIFIKEVKVIKLSNNNIKDKEDLKEKDNDINNEEKKEENKENVNEEYKSSSIKNLLNNNSLLKKDY